MAPSGRAQRGFPLLQLTALVALSSLAVASGCSSFNYVSNAGPRYVASARNMDLPALYDNEIEWVPSGLAAELTPVHGYSNYSALGQTYPVKHAFVCMVAMRTRLIDQFRGASGNASTLPANAWAGACNDGMNSVGLAVALQWQPDTTWWPGYTQPGSPALEQADVVAYLLASFASVSEVKAAFDAGLQVVANPSVGWALHALFNGTFLPCHYGVMDASGQSIVLEMRNGTLAVHDDTLGVLTNQPFYPEQVKSYEEWEYAATRSPYNYTTVHGTQFYAPPGSYNSSNRFTRLAMLKNAADTMVWASDNVLSPGSPQAQPRSGGGSETLMAVMDMIQSVYLPRGLDDTGGYLPPSAPRKAIDWTIWTTMRDQTAMAYYYRTANTPQWSVINLRSVAWPTGIQAVRLDADVWWRDASNSFAYQDN